MANILLMAFLLDCFLADPVWLYHPVQMIGFVSIWLERKLRKLKRLSLYFLGVIHWFLVVVFLGAVFLLIVYILKSWGGIFLDIFYLYTIYSLLAIGSLVREISAVSNFLDDNKLDQARERIQKIVSRNMEKADEKEIVRATIETATENILDGIIAPLFYLVLFGPLGMFVYKIVNTLDSMVGYKNDRYFKFGWFSARVDDVFNFIPARITGFLILLVATMTRDSGRGAWRAWLLDAQKGPSPNGGIPIVTYAGARNIKLGGSCFDQNNKEIPIPFVGGENSFDRTEIKRTIFYVYTVSFLMLLISLVFLKN